MGGAARDFRRTFEVTWRYEALQSTEELTPQELDKIKARAYETCVRLFRGTPCDMPGVVFTKDLAYFVGMQKVWEILIDARAQGKDLVSLMRLHRLAKYDRSDAKQEEIVKKAHQIS